MTPIVYNQSTVVGEVSHGGEVPTTGKGEDTGGSISGEIGDSTGARLIDDLGRGAVQRDIGGVGHDVGIVELQRPLHRVIASGQGSGAAAIVQEGVSRASYIERAAGVDNQVAFVVETAGVRID